MKSVPSLLFFKPMKEEPEEHHWSSLPSYKLHLKIMQTSKGPYLRVSHTIKENPTEDGPQWIRLPYRPGEKCYVREAWRPESPIKGTYKGFLGTGYKDGAFKLTGWPSGFEAYPNGKWRSPVTMPQWAARRFFTIISCEPMQIGEVTIADAEATGVVAAWDGLSANQQEGLKEKYHRDAIGEDDLFYLLWQSKHPGTWPDCWCWRVEGEEVRK